MDTMWLKEAMSAGMTANSFKLGTVLTLGWFWVREKDCSVLYRGLSMNEVDFANILAVAEQEACTISPPGYMPHNSNTTYFYVVRRVNNCGYQERTLSAAVRVAIDADGDLAEPRPNKILLMKAEQVTGSRVELVWYYCPIAQETPPSCFKVFYDGGTGQTDYENPIATINYEGRRFYSYRGDALDTGDYLFAIRAEDAAGVQDASLAAIQVQVEATGPGPVTILNAEAV